MYTYIQTHRYAGMHLRRDDNAYGYKDKHIIPLIMTNNCCIYIRRERERGGEKGGEADWENVKLFCGSVRVSKCQCINQIRMLYIHTNASIRGYAS